MLHFLDAFYCYTLDVRLSTCARSVFDNSLCFNIFLCSTAPPSFFKPTIFRFTCLGWFPRYLFVPLSPLSFFARNCANTVMYTHTNPSTSSFFIKRKTRYFFWNVHTRGYRAGVYLGSSLNIRKTRACVSRLHLIRCYYMLLFDYSGGFSADADFRISAEFCFFFRWFIL